MNDVSFLFRWDCRHLRVSDSWIMLNKRLSEWKNEG